GVRRQLPARGRLHLLAGRRGALGQRAATRGPDGAEPDRADVAGADDRRLHLDVVLGRAGGDDVPGRSAATHGLDLRRGDVRTGVAARRREPGGGDERVDDHGRLPDHRPGDGRDAPRSEARLTQPRARRPPDTAGAATIEKGLAPPCPTRYYTEYAINAKISMSVPYALLALLSEGPKYRLRLPNQIEARAGRGLALHNRP